MRRGFLLTPREPGKASPPQASGSADPPPDASSPKVSKQSSLAASSTTDVVPIPTRYKLPPWLPDFVPDPFSGPICRLTFSFLPRGESRPELCTTFAHCGGMLDALLSQYPGWPLSFSPPPPVYEIVPIKGTGLGMVATADIAAAHAREQGAETTTGSTIVRERPFFVLPRVIPANSMEESLRVAESLVSYLDPENKRAFFALRNSKGHTTPSQVKGILDTNAFIAGPFPTFPAKYAGVARDISRVNHRKYAYGILPLPPFPGNVRIPPRERL
ncbi:hypothetical protein OH76DRAFT_1488339 [Lentinus brumalis]|uniref:Uncharacterized protein n=1 Tax=Lentinus brumalis TaxID=2498619 RepID=A0A371CR89_9APHY|nr:hypothetical protein OH76DRAFT_1488339 [Polyporus brumalis]